MVAILDEVHVADEVHVDRRDRRAAPLRQVEALPALPHPVGGGPELSVEVVPGVDGSGHRVELNGPQAKAAFPAPAQDGDHFV